MLRSLGAASTTDQPDLAPVLAEPLTTDGFEVGLPAGVLEHCTGLALAAGALAGLAVSGVGVAVQLRLPEVMAAAYGSTNAMRPAPPRPVDGGGWVHADLAAPGDEERYDSLMSTLSASAAAAEVAIAAQAWRLPVCDYRKRNRASGAPWVFELGTRCPPVRSRPRILDLTNMWAGPLATWLLSSLGWSVTKVEPSFRPDGFRALDAGGIHPGDTSCDPGRDSALWNALNHGKEIVDLDLRLEADRVRFVELATASDVVIDSFSPRVMPNFGLPLPAGPLYVSVPAFPPGPRRDWVAYGTGIHAVSGLGDVGGGRFAAPAVAYPDPVAGFTAALATVAALDGRRRGLPVSRVESPMFSAVQPLLHRRSDPAQLQTPPGDLGPRLAETAVSCRQLEPREVCGRPLLHPSGIFHTK